MKEFEIGSEESTTQGQARRSADAWEPREDQQTLQGLGDNSLVDARAGFSHSDSPNTRSHPATSLIDGPYTPPAGDNGYERRYRELWKKGEENYVASGSGNWRTEPDQGEDAVGEEEPPAQWDRVAGDGYMHPPGAYFPDTFRYRSNISNKRPSNDEGHGQARDRKEETDTQDDTPSNSWPNEDEVEDIREAHWHNALATLSGVKPTDREGTSTSVEVKKSKKSSPFSFLRRAPSRVSRNLEGMWISVSKMCPN